MSSPPARKFRALSKAIQRRPVRAHTSGGRLRFVRGTLWFFPADMTWRRMQEFHRAAIGWQQGLQLTAAAKVGPQTAATAYHHAVTCFLGQYLASDDRDRIKLFASMLSFVEGSWSFDGLESAFLSGMHTARAVGRPDLVRRGNILWRRIGKPRELGGGFDAIPVYRSVTNTLRFVSSGDDRLSGLQQRSSSRSNGQKDATRKSDRSREAKDGGKGSSRNNSKKGDAANSYAESDDRRDAEARQRHWEWAAAVVGTAGSFAAARGWGLALALVKGTWLEPARLSNDPVDQLRHDDLVADAVKKLGETVALATLSPLAQAIVIRLENAGVLDKVEQLVSIAERIKNEFSNAADELRGELFESFSDALRGLEGSLNEFATEVAGFYGSEFYTSINNAGDALGGLADGLGGLADEAFGAAGELFAALGDAAGTVFGAMGDAAGDAIGFIMGAFGAGDSDSDSGNDIETGEGDASDSDSSTTTTTDSEEDDDTDSPSEDEPDSDEVDSEEQPKPPPADDGYPNPDDDDPYTGGANPYASEICPVGDGLISLVTYADGEFGCGSLPRLGPGGLRIAQLGYLNLVTLLREEFEDQRPHHTDPSPIGNDSSSGGVINPSAIDPGYIDPSPAMRLAALRLALNARLRP